MEIKKKQFLLCRNLFGRINYHQLLNEYVLHNFFAFLSNIIICQEQEQLKTIQLTEKKKKCTSFLGVSIVSLIVICDYHFYMGWATILRLVLFRNDVYIKLLNYLKLTYLKPIFISS